MRFVGRAVRVSLVALAILAAYVAVFSVRVYARGYEKFFRNYLRWVVTPAPQSSTPKYVFFMVADHFEPDYDGARVARWSRRYQELAARHRDSAGRPPQHTFFYPGEQSQADIFGSLREMTQAGLGEVELHYHHDFDTTAMLRSKLEDAITEMQRFGFALAGMLPIRDSGRISSYVDGR